VSHPDENDVQAARKGGREAFDRLIERYQKQAVSVAYQMVSNMDDALEVAQNAFVRAYRALDQLQDPRRFRPWLMRIVTNQALNYRRSRSKHRHLSINSTSSQDGDKEETDLAQQLAGTESSALDKLTANELEEQLKNAIEALPEKLRTSLMLFSVEKLPQKEIAEIMKTSVQAVKWNVFEARRRLKKDLEKWL
jgi:RNA polymerase sigma-70 factor (ECF subfamily)